MRPCAPTGQVGVVAAGYVLIALLLTGSATLRGAAPEDAFKYNIQTITLNDDRTVTVTFSVTNTLNGDSPYNLASDPAFMGVESRLSLQVAWDTLDYTNTGSGVAPALPMSVGIVQGGRLSTNVLSLSGGLYKARSKPLPTNATGTGVVVMEGRPVSGGSTLPVKTAYKLLPDFRNGRRAPARGRGHQQVQAVPSAAPRPARQQPRRRDQRLRHVPQPQHDGRDSARRLPGHAARGLRFRDAPRLQVHGARYPRGRPTTESARRHRLCAASGLRHGQQLRARPLPGGAVQLSQLPCRHHVHAATQERRAGNDREHGQHVWSRRHDGAGQRSQTTTRTSHPPRLCVRPVTTARKPSATWSERAARRSQPSSPRLPAAWSRNGA